MSLDFGCVNKKMAPLVQPYTWRDVALYAIGVGAGTDDLAYLRDNPPPKVLPTYGVVPAFSPVFKALEETGGNLVTLLHSAQRVESIKPFPPEGEMRTTAQIEGIWDMKIGALTIIHTETVVDDEVVSRTAWSLLLRGEGGFGGERPPKLLTTRPPSGIPTTFRVEVPTAENQALLYRLNGDINPIHSDPEVAKQAGFDRPILHGLCSYGIAARVALKELAGDEPERFVSLEARFAKVVMPGDTLVVEGWPLEEKGKAAVTVTVKESGEKSIANCVFVYRP